MKRPKEPAVPEERAATVRRQILSVLTEGPRSAREVSGEIGVSEKEVYGHLDHIRRSLLGSGRRLKVTPAQCRKCGYEFVSRQRLTRPGKCPVCRNEAIHPPAFEVSEDS